MVVQSFTFSRQSLRWYRCFLQNSLEAVAAVARQSCSAGVERCARRWPEALPPCGYNKVFKSARISRRFLRDYYAPSCPCCRSRNALSRLLGLHIRHAAQLGTAPICALQADCRAIGIVVYSMRRCVPTLTLAFHRKPPEGNLIIVESRADPCPVLNTFARRLRYSAVALTYRCTPR